MKLTYNLGDVITQIMFARTVEQREMVKDITRDMQNNRAVTGLITELAERAIDHKKKPVDTLGLTLMYGIVIGLSIQVERKPN